MKTFEPLYARDSNGRINEWLVSVHDGGVMTINEGLVDGVKTATHRTCKAKNVGKMNETSPVQQAESEAESRWIKKKKQGYKSVSDLNITLVEVDKFLLLNEFHIALNTALPFFRTDANNRLKPMKCQPYFNDKGEVRIKFPCFGQPKLNGFRCVSQWEKVLMNQGTLLEEETFRATFTSKEGMVYDILNHIDEEFTEEMFKWQINGKDIKLAFDGEMYIHGEILSEISSAVRKRNAKTPLVKFYIFDLSIEELNQAERLKILEQIQVFVTKKNLKNIIIVPTTIVDTNEQAQTLTDGWIKEGYEGGIFRDSKALYQFGSRPKTITKLKRFQDKEFKILDVVGGDNSPELGVFVCEAENGKTFKCTPEGNHDKKKEYLTNKIKYIGKALTVRFFERTKDELPFHAVGIDIRDYE